MDKSIYFKLVSYSYVPENGKMVQAETETPVFGFKASVSQQEYFAAFNAGLRAEYLITMFSPDYENQKVLRLEENGVWVDYDIYRTYEKQNEQIELFVTKRNMATPYTVTMFTDGKQVKLHGVYLTGSHGANNAMSGDNATDAVVLTIPRDCVAFVGLTPVGFVKPKAYGRLTTTQKANAYTIAPNCYFALGDIDPTGDYTYQSVNSAYDDVYRVQSVNSVNKGNIDTEYIEVRGK